MKKIDRNTNDDAIRDEIILLKKQKGALIVAHNYQIPAVQDIADFVGDSLELAKKAAEAEKNTIVFCGVHFMAESAAIFSPEKTVLIPDPDAGCSLAASIDSEELLRWKANYPNAVVVSYVNTTAEIKALSDYCVTSTNAVQVVNSIPSDKQILFIPDMFLGQYVKKMTGRDIIIYPGECHVHARVRPSDVIKKLGETPEADFLIHPECGCVSACMHYKAEGDIPSESTFILSTSGMMKHAANSKKDTFVVATETGILHPLRQKNPTKKFIPLRDDMVCEFMKMITLPKVRDALKYNQFRVTVPPAIAKRARIPIERMFAVSTSP